MAMRRSALILTLLLAPALEGTAQPRANTSPGLPASVGNIDFGARFFDVSGDPARDQRYRDLRSGPTLDRVRYTRDRSTWMFSAGADHAGYRDQRYFATFMNAGTVKASFDWNQIPLFNSTSTRTPYTSPSPGVFRIDDAIQGGIQAGTLRLSDVAPTAAVFDLRSRREIAAFHVTATPTRNLDVTLNVNRTARKGAQPWGIGFDFANLVEVAAPLDHRTTDVGTSVEWANSQAMARVGFDGSWFENSVESLVVDNPLRLTDGTTGGSQARMALWPSSSSNAVSAAGSIKFPWRSRATAVVSVGDWQQNQPLIPFTINTAIAPIPLARPTAEANARITAMNYNVTSRPLNRLWLNARFKRYDFDNRTPVFPVTNYVRLDRSVAASITGGSEPIGYVRDNFDADVSFTPLPFTALRAGYGREEVSRTHRFFERTVDNVVRGTVDFTGNAFVTLRMIYEHSRRTGTGLDEQVLDEIGEQVSLRQFDISDRDRDRVSAVIQVTPIDQLGFTASIAGGNDRRPDAPFGLSHNDNRVYAVSVDAVPGEGTTFGVSYGFEDYKTAQNSRQASAGPQFNDPTRNWSTNGFERVHTANAGVDLLNLVAKTELHVAYDFSRSTARYLYSVPVNSTLPPITQLPPILNELHHGVVDVRYLLQQNFTLGVVYSYDRYNVDDFALGEDTLRRIDMTPTVLLLANAYRPYRSNTVRFRLTYDW
jgi:MtrB/PioB family decaheme-associated outer membrane protein